MAGCVEVLERVHVLRILAAADMAARQAKPQLIPCRADRHAIHAAVAARPDLTDLAEMLATLGIFSRVHWPPRKDPEYTGGGKTAAGEARVKR